MVNLDARWSAIWAGNGTIQTSDIREKNTIEDETLDFINELRPVKYKFNVDHNDVSYNPIMTIDEQGN